MWPTTNYCSKLFPLLLQPFWPTGSGCARGFLSSFDACWMLRSWASGAKPILDVIAERESIYRLLGQTTPENLNKEHAGYTIDPHSRYPNLNLRVVMPFQVKNLFDTDEKFPDVLDSALEHHQMERQRPKRRRGRNAITNHFKRNRQLNNDINYFLLSLHHESNF